MAAILGLQSFLAYIPGIACIAMLFVCGRMLFGGHHEPDRNDEIAELRAELAELRAQLAARTPENAAHE